MSHQPQKLSSVIQSSKHSSQSIQKYLYFYNSSLPILYNNSLLFPPAKPRKSISRVKMENLLTFRLFVIFLCFMLKGKFCLQFVDNNCVFLCLSFIRFIYCHSNALLFSPFIFLNSFFLLIFYSSCSSSLLCMHSIDRERKLNIFIYCLFGLEFL